MTDKFWTMGRDVDGYLIGEDEHLLEDTEIIERLYKLAEYENDETFRRREEKLKISTLEDALAGCTESYYSEVEARKKEVDERTILAQRMERMKRAAEWWKARAVEEHSEYEVLALDQYPTDDDILAAEALAAEEEA